jgi:NAD(P)-dependent dehydrogenase (short-subunit alcohol dehydrogenase family)
VVTVRAALVPEHDQASRVGYLRDVIAAAAFLASDEASYVGGRTRYVDGGNTLAWTEESCEG